MPSGHSSPWPSHPSLITREFWIGLWSDPNDPFLMHDAERGWDEQYAGTVGAHLDRSIPSADLETLLSASTKVKDFADEHIAHSVAPLSQATPSTPVDAESVPANVTLTVKDVHEAIDVIGDLFKRYYNLLTASSFVMLEPVIQHDWEAIFREPWIRPQQVEGPSVPLPERPPRVSPPPR
jgi:hypothetical protein